MNDIRNELSEFIIHNLNKNYLSIIDRYTESSDNIEIIKHKLLSDYINHFVNAISIIDGEKPEYKNINFKTTKILVNCLIKNCTPHIEYIKNFFDTLSDNIGDIKLFFLTNNNIDKTENILKEWIIDKPNINGIFNYESINEHSNRIELLGELRNECLKQSINKFGSDFDYLIIFDTDLVNDIDVEKLLKAISIDKNWSAIFGNMTFKNSSYHYDILALRQLNQIDNILDIYPDFKKYYGINSLWLNKLFILKDLVEVKSAFGGIGIFKMKEIVKLLDKYENLFETKNYPEFTCEHISLCDKLDNKKFIYSDLNHQTSSSLEPQVLMDANVFIPRDAGFFSVFNFYIGSLTTGIRSYPFYNKQAFLHVNQNQNKHFAYWTENINCWFDYFKPIEFYTNDDTHTSKNLLKFRISGGFNAPKQFTHPEAFDRLMGDKELFSKWRNHVNLFFKKYIQFRPEIVNRAKEFIDLNFSTPNIIAVHYRHPNHVCESGNVYLKQYFERIDEVISNNPNCEIFLATDNEFGLLAFSNKYGNRLKYIQDITRLSLDNFLDWGYKLMKKKDIDIVGMIDGEGPELHHQILNNNFDTKKPTIDLLTEVNCILQCKWFVHTVSNISLAVSYMNPNIEMIFVKGSRT